jgi:murein L,D-transpeptidase YcbB/YkuD
LKSGIHSFLSTAHFGQITKLPAVLKDNTVFRRLLQKRLKELGLVTQDTVLLDSVQLSLAVKEFQKDRGITVDGKAGAGTIRMLNMDDREKFIRIAISMDKYKKLPAKMPEKYIWVNASSNLLRVMENGKQKFISRVVTGKPLTRTPMLTSTLSALITYPQWVPPASIILKEILPAVKKNPGYLAKKGFSLLDDKGEEVDPYSVDWTRYNKSIPYKVVQGSGDANALGIIKFYFDNKYAVYLHDTNQRYLFGNAMRNLSHGCVRVQEWRELLYYILQKDSLQSGASRRDSVNTWLKNKEKRQIALKSRIPVFIRYLTCEGQNGRILFYDDVYGDDKMLRENYFSRK